MRFYCEAYEVITEEKKVSFCIVLAFILDIHIKCLRLLKCLKKYQI